MRTEFIDTGEHVIVAGPVAIRVDIDHRAVDLEQCDHFFNMGVDDESVRFPGRFIDVATFPCHPVMLEVAPLAFHLADFVTITSPADPQGPHTLGSHLQRLDKASQSASRSIRSTKCRD